jgi:hypothetical protein
LTQKLSKKGRFAKVSLRTEEALKKHKEKLAGTTQFLSKKTRNHLNLIMCDSGSKKIFRQRPTLPLSLPSSTIGAKELNFRVRDGNGCFLFAIATEKTLTFNSANIWI